MNDDNTWREKIAPSTVDLPVIMTMANPQERVQLINRFKRSYVCGAWCGPYAGGTGRKKPALQMRTDKSRSNIANNNRLGNVITFLAVHIALLAADKYPTEEHNYASHLCHKWNCLNHVHIVWESASRNLRRERLCRRQRRCICGLAPGCDFSLH